MKKITKLIIVLILIAILIFIYFKSIKTSNNKLISYPERPKLEFTRTLLEDNENYTKEKVIFQSKDAKIYGYLFLPKKKEKTPAVIFLPAAQATKEGATTEAKVFLNDGFAVLTIDQRGVGETDSKIPSQEENFNNFKQNKESFENLMVYDALRAFDLLSQVKEVDSSKIIMSGASMGGRNAIISAAIEKKIHAALIISSAGYNIIQQNPDLEDFLYSINPNNYISLISPRKIIMIHSKNDKVIPLEDAKFTYDLAKQPKNLIIMQECNHGYCDEMTPYINQALEDLIF